MNTPTPTEAHTDLVESVVYSNARSAALQIAESEARAIAAAVTTLTCTHHNDQQRAACPVCLVAALTAERDQIRSDCENETKWAAHYLAQSIAEKARAERAEAELATAQAQAKLWEDKCHELIAPHYILDPCLRAHKFREALQYHPVLPTPFWKKYGGPNDT